MVRFDSVLLEMFGVNVVARLSLVVCALLVRPLDSGSEVDDNFGSFLSGSSDTFGVFFIGDIFQINHNNK